MKTHYDLIVIGGGAAGIFGAVIAAQRGLSVCVLEKRAALLAKVKVSGGGRCNVTHACFDPKQLVLNYPRGSKELLGPLHRFGPEQTVQWFAEHGVMLKTEEDGRMFPLTDQSQTVIDCLLGQATAYGVDILFPSKISYIDLGFHLQVQEQVLQAPNLLLATGSAPEGYLWAQQFGHAIEEPVPSLFTLNCPSSPLLPLSGIAIEDVQLSVEGVIQRGALLLTHFGFSGPAALKLSAWAARKLHAKQYQATITVDWLPHETPEQTTKRLLELKHQQPQKQLSNLYSKHLPKRLWEFLVGHDHQLQQLTDRSLAAFSHTLHKSCYRMEGKTTHKEEFVTCGGIKCDQVDFRTMQSRHTPGLYFAGEILNIDGVTGGFNFQNAWTTAWIAATALSQET